MHTAKAMLLLHLEPYTRADVFIPHVAACQLLVWNTCGSSKYCTVLKRIKLTFAGWVESTNTCDDGGIGGGGRTDSVKNMRI